MNTKPLDIYDDFELIDKYLFDRQSIMMICDMLQDDLESSTFRNRASTTNMKVFVALRFYASGSFQGVIEVIVDIKRFCTVSEYSYIIRP
jgi:hypothetical protein